MMRYINGPHIYNVWLSLLVQLLRYPEHTPSPRGLRTREITGMILRVNDWRNNIITHPIRNLNYRFMVAEWLWIVSGSDDLDTIAKYNGQMRRFSDDGKVLAGAYGPRLSSQWDYVVKTLREDSDSRQAIATIWTPNPEPSKDTPCTISLQFIQRDNRLNVIVTMRSSDTWLGIPYDVFTFSMLANGIAGELKLEPGYIQMQLGSSHLYDDNVERAIEVIGQPGLGRVISSPRLPGRIPESSAVRILENPGNTSPVQDDPWVNYALVLASNTWTDAQQELINIETSANDESRQT